MRWVGGFVLGLLFGALFGYSLAVDTRHAAASDESTTTPARPSGRTMWTHGPVNVRAGRSTEAEVVQTLTAHTEVTVDSLRDGWYQVLSRGKPVGWSSATVLHPNSAPSFDFEVASFTYRVTERNQVWWRYSWSATIANTGRTDLYGLTAEVTFLDDDGYVLETQRAYDINVRAGDRRTVREFDLIDVQTAPRVSTAEIRVAR